MREVTIYHNPRCSKSRGALAILQEKFSPKEITEIRYLENPPNKSELESICEMLAVEPFAIIRTGEALFKELLLNKQDQRSRQEWIEIMVSNPKLIERPIVIYQNKAVIARPPEKVMEIL
jgi:arsenate reductase